MVAADVNIGPNTAEKCGGKLNCAYFDFGTVILCRKKPKYFQFFRFELSGGLQAGVLRSLPDNVFRLPVQMRFLVV